MNVTFIHHSSFLVETEPCYLLFDYYDGRIPAMDPGKPLYVLTSHGHPDHYSPAVYNAGEPGQTIRYLFSTDIPKSSVPKELLPGVVFLKSRDTWRDDLVSVETLRSTDKGAAFWVHAGGKELYHAGDLNDWYWSDGPKDKALEQRYIRELERIRGRTADAAFIPFDPRLEQKAVLGVDLYMKAADARVIFPMHFWNLFEIIKTVKQLPETAPYRDRIMDVEWDGQLFTV